ncbi:uncharacterized protein [Lepisosteus oculatus]|uniref:uncharacterized protein n=1 Tax=Lepisosteus oculatus TaxID=7918 RepID=UPI0007405383|nr:PREDICTED: uncharacterized protein LOC107076571 [Lepisosteus oculatus]
MMTTVLKMPLWLTCLLLPLSSCQFLESSSVPRSCVYLHPSEPGTRLPLPPQRGEGGEGQIRPGSAGFLSSFTVAQGCVLTLWGGKALEGPRSFPSGTYFHVSLGLGEEWDPTDFHCSCEDQQGDEESNDQHGLRPRENPYKKFVRQHVDNSVQKGDINYCKRKMKMINTQRGTCKLNNTFIHADESQVKKVCTENPQKDPRKHKSSKPFPLTVCEREGQTCNYKTTNTKNHILITCNKENQPVHFDKLLASMGSTDIF